MVPRTFWLVVCLLRGQIPALSGPPCMLIPFYTLLPLRSSLFEFCHFNHDVSQSGPLWAPLNWDPPCFLDSCEFFSPPIKEVFHHYFFKQVFYPLLLFSFWFPCYTDIIRKSWLKHTPRMCWGPESTYNSLKLQDQLFKPYTGLGH